MNLFWRRYKSSSPGKRGLEKDIHTSRIHEGLVYLLLVAIFSILPTFLPIGMLTKILIFAIFVMGFNIIFGNTGYLSFGHAAFFGLGAYGTGITMVRFDVSIWLGILVGISIATFAGLIVGYFSLKRTGIYYGMSTLAFGEVFYYIVFQWKSLTGGDNGLPGIPEPVVNFPIKIPLDSPQSFYGFVLLFFLIVVFLVRRITISPFGKVLFAIRENENRASACGFNVRRAKLMAFLFSAIFAGLAGSLYALYLEYVPINSLSWLTGGKVVIMNILGGAGTFWGPVVGAAIYILLEETASTLIYRWEIVVGLIALCFIVFLPRGIVGSLVRGWRREWILSLVKRWLGGKPLVEISNDNLHQSINK